MSRMKYLTSILGIAVLMVVVAACGSGSSVNTVTPPASAVQPNEQSGEPTEAVGTPVPPSDGNSESVTEMVVEDEDDQLQANGTNLNRDEIVDVVANLDWSAPVTPSTPAGIAVGEPYPIPTADKSCGPMAIVAITSGGQVSCIDPYGSGMANDGPDGQVVDPQTPVTPPTPDLTHGSPPALSGAPVPSLKFDGVDYVHSSYAELPSGEGALFVIGGIEVDVTNLELVGTTTEGRTTGIDQGLEIYRSHIAGDTDAVYTFTPGKSWVNPEDGQIFESPASWTRWASTDLDMDAVEDAEFCSCLSIAPLLAKT